MISGLDGSLADGSAHVNTLILCLTVKTLYRYGKRFNKRLMIHMLSPTHLATSRAILIRKFHVNAAPLEDPKGTTYLHYNRFIPRSSY